MKKISQEVVMNIPFKFTYPEQLRIVAYLDNLRAKIDTTTERGVNEKT